MVQSAFLEVTNHPKELPLCLYAPSFVKHTKNSNIDILLQLSYKVNEPI